MRDVFSAFGFGMLVQPMYAHSPMALRVACLVAVVAYCCQPEGAAVRADLIDYIRVLGEWATDEAETSSAISRILRTHFVDEAEVRRQITEDLPRVHRQVDRIRLVKPTTNRLRAIHERYINAWTRLSEGYSAILRGLDTGDASSLAAGRAELEQWRDLMVALAVDVRRLANQVGVEITNKDA